MDFQADDLFLPHDSTSGAALIKAAIDDGSVSEY